MHKHLTSKETKLFHKLTSSCKLQMPLLLQEIISTSLLKLNSENAGRAVKMFLGIQKFVVDGPEAMPTVMRYEMAQKLLHQVFPKFRLKESWTSLP